MGFTGMAHFAGKFESRKQEWSTPQELFGRINEVFAFDFDLSAVGQSLAVLRMVYRSR